MSFHAIRTPLYPGFISLLDRKDGRELPELDGTITCYQEDNRFLNVIRAQKIIWIVSLVVLLWVLSGSINCWLLALLTYLAALADRDPLCSQLVNLHCLMTEGINYSLVFLYLAAVWAYLRRAARWRLLGLALVLVVMLLHRPANAPFLAIVPVLGLFHWLRSERKQAWLVPAVVATIVGGYALIHFSINYYRVGYFRPHALTGSQCICTTLQVAALEDVGTVGDPQLDEFLRTCLVDHGSRRVLDHRSDPHGEYVNINIYQVAEPAYHRVFGAGNAWHEDEVFARVARHLFCRHPWACVKLAIYHFGGIFWDPLPHTLCAACLGIAFMIYWRTRRFEWLFLAYVGVCPFLLAIPACAIEFPLPRYRSQMYFAEVLMLPLAITLGIGHLRSRSIATNRRSEESLRSRLRAA